MDLSKVDLFAPGADLEMTDPRLVKILNASLAGYRGGELSRSPAIYWDAASVGLDGVQVFQRLDTSAREQILTTHSADLMREAAYIEVAGLSYTARMSLESPNLEERLFYATMAAEEAKHFSLLRPYVADEVFARGPDTFTGLIGQMILEADREEVIFLIQVLLEGWGLTHFNWMGGHCQNKSLKAVFKTILKDEARHHAAGLALADCVIELGDRRVVQWLEIVLSAVCLGPTRLIGALEACTGTLSSATREQVLKELDARTTVLEDLARLRTLIEPFVDLSVMRHFEEKRLLQPAF